MHDCALVVVIAPEALRDDLGDYSAAESRHMRCRTSHVCKARFVTRSLIRQDVLSTIACKALRVSGTNPRMGCFPVRF